MKRIDTKQSLLLGAVLLLAAGLRVQGLGYGLPELFEEATPMRQAWEMWGWEGRGFDLNPHFFHYPAFTFYVHLLAQAVYFGVGWLAGTFASPNEMYVLYQQDPTQVVLLARAINVGFGLAAVYLVARMGRCLWGGSVGLAAAAILAVLPEHVSSSRIIGVDTPLSAFTVLALLGACRVFESGGMRGALWCGLWVGLAASCKYTGALLAVPFLVAYLLQAHRRGISPLRAFWSAQPWAAGGAALAGFLLTSPFCLLDAGTFWQHFSYERFHMSAGHFGIDPTAAPITYARELWRSFGITLMPFLLLGTGLRLARLRQEPRWAPLLVFCLGYLALISTWSMQAPHYLLPALPGLALFAAGGVWDFKGWLGVRVSLPRWASAGLLSGLLLIPLAWTAARTVQTASGPDTRVLARDWIQTHVPPGSLIAREHYTPELPETCPAVIIPMFTVGSELTAPCYDLRLYAGFHYIITSDGVSDRYLANPRRFPKQTAFYRDLETRWQLAARFAPESAAGPTISVYRNPAPDFGPADDPLDPELYQRLTHLESHLSFLLELGQVYAGAGQSRKAADTYARLIELKPDDPRAHALLGLLYYGRGDTTAAVAVFTRALEEVTEAHDRAFSAGMLTFIRGHLDSTVTQWERAVALAPHELPLYRNLVMLYRKIGRPDRALDTCLKAIRTAPGQRRLYTQALDLCLQQGRPRKADTLCTQALRLWPGDAELWLRFGRICEVLEDRARAEDAYTEAARLAPRNSDAFAFLGSLAYRQGDLDRAVEVWSDGITADSTNSVFYTNLGTVYLQRGDLTRAAEIWKRGMRISPDDPDLPYNLAIAYRKQGQDLLAETVLEQALESIPDDADLHHSLADILETRGDVAGAVRHYEAAARLAPDRDVFRSHLERLRKR